MGGVEVLLYLRSGVASCIIERKAIMYAISVTEYEFSAYRGFHWSAIASMVMLMNSKVYYTEKMELSNPF